MLLLMATLSFVRLAAQTAPAPPSDHKTVSATPFTFSAVDQPLEVLPDSSGKGYFVRKQNVENAFFVEHQSDKLRRDWSMPIVFGDRVVADAHVISMAHRDRMITLAYTWENEGRSFEVARVMVHKGLKSGKNQAESLGRLEPDPLLGRFDVRAVTDKVENDRILTVHLICVKRVVRAITLSLFNPEPENLQMTTVDLPVALADLKVSGMAIGPKGEAVVTLVGHDPNDKPNAVLNRNSMYMVHLTPEGASSVEVVDMDGLMPVCLTCAFDASGAVRCGGMGINPASSEVSAVSMLYPAEGNGDPKVTSTALDAAQAEQLFFTEDMLDFVLRNKPDKDAAKHKQQGISRFAQRMQPFHFQRLEGDSMLFVAEIQERTETIDHQDINPDKVDNRGDHVCSFLMAPDGSISRISVVQKFVGEQGGNSGFIRTKVAYRHGRLYLFYNDNKLNEFAQGAAVPPLAPGIYVSGPNIIKFADAVVYVEDASGPVKRQPVQQGKTPKPVFIYGAMSKNLTEKDLLLFLSWNGTGGFNRLTLE